MNFQRLIEITLIWMSISPISLHLFGASPRSLVREGNDKCATEQYDEALTAYEEASIELPESPILYFNKGVAYYGKGEFDNAAEAFESAALKTKDLELEAKAKFNLGNCAFRQSERQRDSDLQKSLEECEKSIRYYQEALKLKPDYREAAENIEVVRLVMKSILDEIKKQQETAQEQKKNQEKIANKLKELIEKQQAVADETQALHKDRMAKGDLPETPKEMKGLSNNQKGIKQSTEKLALELASPLPQQSMTPQTQQPPAPTPSPMEGVKAYVDTAVTEQSQALENLDQSDTEMAHQNQEEAVESLKKALEALAKQGHQGQQQQDENQREQQQQQQQKQGEQREQEQQSAEGQQSPSGKEGEDKEPEQHAMSALKDEAKDILDEEKENQKRRQLPMSGGYRPVDKDW